MEAMRSPCVRRYDPNVQLLDRLSCKCSRIPVNGQVNYYYAGIAPLFPWLRATAGGYVIL